MFIEKLKLENFRNYINEEISFINGINLFVGDNAQGKTNIIEAIYVTAFSKSYRASKDCDLINFSGDFARIRLDYTKNDSKRNVEIFIDKNSKKSIKDDGLKVSKNSDIIGNIMLVMFTPDDLDIIKGSPESRRNFIDSICCQLSKSYMMNLQEYNKCLKMKNSILKNDVGDADTQYIHILNEKMSSYIEKIVDFRGRVINFLLQKAKSIHLELTNNLEDINLIYLSDFVGLDKNKILEVLNSYLNVELIRKTSLKGIQRDDIEILVNDFKVERFGSQGQKRTCLLSLKLANFEVLKEIKNEVPILLLDDIMSELDVNRVGYLLKYIEKYQSVITTTDADFVKDVENINIQKIYSGCLKK